MQDRLIELETRIAFQEDTLQELNDIIVRQQREIEQLQRMVKLINRQLTTLSPAEGSLPQDEPPPPHY